MCMSIALTNLGKYNEGVLDFVWLELPATDEEIAAAFDKIQVSHDDIKWYSNGLGEASRDGSKDFYGEYEEYFITDYECDFYEVGEYENLDSLNELADTIENLQDYEKDIVKALMSELGYTLENAINNVDDCYLWTGCHDMTDVAYEYVESCDLLHDVPDSLKNYFDYEAFGRDLSFDCTWIETNEGMLEVR